MSYASNETVTSKEKKNMNNSLQKKVKMEYDNSGFAKIYVFTFNNKQEELF